MKLINEKGKLFGIINLVDLLVALVIVAIIAVVAIQLMQDTVTDVVTQKTEIWMEVEVIGAHPRYYNEVARQDLTGSKLVAGNVFQDATIEAVWFEDYIAGGLTDEGTYVYEVDSYKKEVVFLIKGYVSAGTPTPTVANQEARAGRTFIVKTQTTEMSGTIRYVEIGQYTGTIGDTNLK